jgi:hypothetical protein
MSKEMDLPEDNIRCAQLAKHSGVSSHSTDDPRLDMPILHMHWGLKDRATCFGWFTSIGMAFSEEITWIAWFEFLDEQKASLLLGLYRREPAARDVEVVVTPPDIDPRFIPFRHSIPLAQSLFRSSAT